MKAIDNVFRPMDFYDKLERRGPISIKKSDAWMDTQYCEYGDKIATTQGRAPCRNPLIYSTHTEENLSEKMAQSFGGTSIHVLSLYQGPVIYLAKCKKL